MDVKEFWQQAFLNSLEYYRYARLRVNGMRVRMAPADRAQRAAEEADGCVKVLEHRYPVASEHVVVPKPTPGSRVPVVERISRALWPDAEMCYSVEKCVDEIHRRGLETTSLTAQLEQVLRENRRLLDRL